MFGVSRVGWHRSVHAYSTTEWLPRAATGSVVLPLLVWLSAIHCSSAHTHTFPFRPQVAEVTYKTCPSVP